MPESSAFRTEYLLRLETRVLVAHDGAEKVLGTSPLTTAVLNAGGSLLTAGLATHNGACGKVIANRNEGRPRPEGWGVHSAGRPTTGPVSAAEDSMIQRPIHTDRGHRRRGRPHRLPRRRPQDADVGKDVLGPARRRDRRARPSGHRGALPFFTRMVVTLLATTLVLVLATGLPTVLGFL